MKVGNIRFKYDHSKALQTIIWFLNRHGGKIDKLKLVKLVFFADREHLANYGRPIIGGSYYALPHGPVLSEFLDDLNKNRWESESGISIRDKYIIGNCTGDEDFFSESDIEVLEHIDSEFGPCDPWRLRNMTHDLKAWLKNDPKDSRRPLPYADFFLDLSGKEGMLDLIRDEQQAWADFM